MRIYVIGLPGVGKSTIGSNLAKRIEYEFVDMDSYIEKQAMMFVDEIFANYGEQHFRDLETNALIELKNKKNVIIACGGGVVKNINNKKHMDGLIILLTASLDDIDNRIKSSPIERPLMATNKLIDLYNERKTLYESFKDIEVENNGIDECINKIIEKIGGYNEKSINY